MSFILLGILNSQAVGGGTARAFELIETQVLTTSATSFTLNTIPQEYKHLQLRMLVNATTSNGTRNLFLRFNGDATASYADNYLYNSGTTRVHDVDSARSVGVRAGYQLWGGGPGPTIVDITNYSSSDANTVTRFFYAANDDGHIRIEAGGSSWSKTEAVTSIEIREATGFSMAAGSQFSLYGIRG